MKKSFLFQLSSAALLAVLVLSALPVSNAKAVGETITSTELGGAWNNPDTWVGGVVPDAIDDSVVIATDSIVVLSGATTVKGSLTINALAELQTNNQSLRLEGDFVNNGMFTTGDSAISIAGTATQNIAGFETGGAVSMIKTGGVATFTGSVKYDGLTINGAGGTLNLGVGNAHVILGNLTLTAGTLDGGSSSIQVNDSVLGTGAAFTPGTSAFIYGDNGSQTVAPLTYYNLKIQGSGTKTAGENIAVNGYLRVQPGANFTVGVYDLTVTGSTIVFGTLAFNSAAGTQTFNGLVNIVSGGVWNNNTGNAPIHLRGGLTFNGSTFNSGTGTYYFETNSQAIGGTKTFTIQNISIEAGQTVTNNNSGGLVVTATLGGAGTLTQGVSGVLKLSLPNSGFSLSTLNASASGNTVNYSGDVQTVHPIAYHHLTLSGSGAKTLPAGLTNLPGNLTLEGSARATTVDDLDIDGNLSISGSAVLTVDAFNFNVDGTTSITGASTLSNGELVYDNATGASHVGAVTIGAHGMWNNSGNAPVTFQNGLSYSGKASGFTSGSGAYTFQTTASQSIGGTVAFTIQNLVVDTGVNLTNNNTGGLTASDSLTGAGTLTQGAAGVLNIGAADGNFTLSALDASAAGNTVNYSGAAQTVWPITYHHLTLSGSGATTLTGVTTVNGNFVTSGTAIATTAANLTIGGSLTVGSTAPLTVGGFDFTVSGATTVSGNLTFDSAPGTKLFVGLVTINGSGDWINSGNASFTFRGGLNGDISSGGATAVYTFDTTAAQTIDGTVVVYNLVVGSGVTLTNNDTVTVWTALSGAGTWTQGTSSFLIIKGTATIATLNASASGNTVRYDSPSPQTVLGVTYHHLDLRGGSVKTLPAGLTTVNGNLSLTNGGTSAILANNLMVGGSVNINSSTTLNVSASNYALNVNGNFTGSGTFTSQSGTVTLQGSSAQTISNNTATFYNLVINNTAGVTLSNNVTVNGTLTFTNGKLNTDTFSLVIGDTGSIAGASAAKYVNGNVKKSFAVSGSPQSFTYPIGDATNYTPVDITVDSVSTTGYITAKATSGEHPNIDTVFGIDKNQDANRYWTLTPASIVYSTYSAVFNFVAGDLDAGADTSIFLVRRYDQTAAAWNAATTGTRASTSTQATGIPNSLNVFSFAVGEGDEIAPAITNVTSAASNGSYNAPDVISGITVTFSETVHVTGIPQLTLETGAADAVLNYSSGSGTDTLTFSDYTVQAGDTTSDLDAASLALNGGSIKDGFGNSASLALSGTSLAANKDIVIDTTAPQTQIDSQPADPTNSVSASFTFSANDTATFECQVDGGGYGSCSSPYADTLAGGSHTFDVRATDSVGNTDSTPASYTWTIDTTAPSTQIDSQPSNPTNSLSAAFTYSSDDPAATFECQVDGGGYSACASPYTVAEGAHTFDVRASDTAGNTDATPASYAWTVDTTAPTVISSVRVHPSPTDRASVQYTVTFSESVTGVNTADFSVTMVTVTGASVAAVSGSGTTYTVTVNTGSGDGTIRLNVLDDNSIVDAALNPQNGAFTTGATYTVSKTKTFQSTGSYDGWVLESTATSSKGGTLNSTATTFNLGDDAAKKQYRAILHFNTATLPDTAVITSVTLKFLKSTGGSGSTSTLGALLADMTKPSFGATGLAKTDFEAAAGKATIFNTFTIASNWYSATMKSTGLAYVNRLGATQIRLRFAKGDDGDGTADYLLFYSGNYTTATKRPQLIVKYYVP